MARYFSLLLRYCLGGFLILLVAGCQRTVEPTDGQSGQGKLSSAPSPSAPTDEGTAKEKLRMALESWQFGDSEEALKKKHPEIASFSTFGALVEYMPNTPKLQKFEITSGRATTQKDAPSLKVFEFNVIHTFESKAGTEIKKSHVYEVWTAAGKKWDIMAKNQ